MRRRLPSLQKQIEDYSRKAWYTVPPARGVRGVNPNAPREPGDFGAQVRLAARVVDELVGGHPANLGLCDCPPCDCAWAPGRYEPCAHDLLCPHGRREESEEVVSRRLMSLMSRMPHLEEAFGRGVDAVYAAAGLTPGEVEVARYKHEGLSHRSIAALTGRAEGTVFALYSRGAAKLKRLALAEAA